MYIFASLKNVLKIILNNDESGYRIENLRETGN